jgi:hypothetical protein
MKNKLRRYEMLLPVRFNDGKDIPDALLAEAVNEVVAQFNAVAFYKRLLKGNGGTTRPCSATTSLYLRLMFLTPRPIANG